MEVYTQKTLAVWIEFCKMLSNQGRVNLSFGQVIQKIKALIISEFCSILLIAQGGKSRTY